MISHVSRHATWIIDNDHNRELPIFADESEHLVEAGTLRQFSGYVISKRSNHFVAASACIFAASCFLGTKPVTFFGLALRRYAAINHRLLFSLSTHGANPSLGFVLIASSC